MTNDPNITEKKKLGLGCSTFGGSKSKKAALQALHTSYEMGINYFDIARSYGYGQAESIVGEFIKDKRGKVVVASKFGITPPKPFPFMSQVKDMVRSFKKLAPSISQKLINSYFNNTVERPTVTPRTAIQTLEKSLSELGTDYLDFYLLHNCTFDTAMEEDICAALDKAKDKGMVKAWGASCEEGKELPKFFNNKVPFGIVQFPYATDGRHLHQETSFQKVVFSIMRTVGNMEEPSPAFFERLLVNQMSPGLVKNLQEAWLYVASRELNKGILICSMTQAKHIQRNFNIVNGPDIAATALNRMKAQLLSGEFNYPSVPYQLKASPL